MHMAMAWIWTGMAVVSLIFAAWNGTMDIAEKDPLEIYVDGNSIVLRKYRPSCIFCDSTKDVRTFRGKNVCPRCLRELRERT